jgi:hypothetical protein
MKDELALLREARPDAAGPAPELARAKRSVLMSEITVPPRQRPKLRKRAVLLAASTAVAAAAALVGVTMSDRSDSTAWAAPLVRVAETAPRLVVDAPGWSVSRADEFGVGYGEMAFSNGERRLDLHWKRGADFGTKLADPRSDAASLGTIAVQGSEARLFRYAGSTDFVATWSHRGYGLQARGIAPDLATFTALLRALHAVTVDAWLSAMPESVVKPEGRSKVVLGMLEGVPLPPGYDVAPLLRAREGAVLDRYQLGAQVTGSITCAWLDRWVAARQAGDARGVRQAVGALASSHQWRILHDMKAEGDFPLVLWKYADAVAADAPIKAGRLLTIEESYHDALGCPAG